VLGGYRIGMNLRAVCATILEEYILHKHRNAKSLDEKDMQILEMLQNDARVPLGKIANKLGVPKSTVHYRIKKLEVEKIIKGYYAKVDATRLGKDYTTITFVRAKRGETVDDVGNMLTQIPGVCAVYFILGDNDFVVLASSDDKEDFMKKLQIMYNMPEIERTNTVVVVKTIKEDPRVDLS
jgi:DNA-binding Lrp family transcriptional regulator